MMGSTVRVLYEQPWYESPVLVLVLDLNWPCHSGLDLGLLVL